MKYKGIIFDLDGVLCSTDRFHFEAWKQTAEEVGAPFDETINMKLRGVSRMESLEIILSGSSKTFTDAEKERLATEKNNRYRKLLAQMSPADMPTAVRDALTALHNAGLKLAVGSSSKNAAYILERLDANRYFDAVCDGTMIAHSKPDPEIFLLAAEKLWYGHGLEKTRLLKHLYMLPLLAVSFVLFHAADLPAAGQQIAALFGFGGLPASGVESLYYLRSYAVVLVIALLGATPLPAKAVQRLRDTSAGSAVLSVAEPVALVLLLAVCTAYLVDGSFNPFLYFRF